METGVLFFCIKSNECILELELLEYNKLIVFEGMYNCLEGHIVDMKCFWLNLCLSLVIDESCKDRKSSLHTYCYLVKFPSCLVSYVCKLYTKFQKKTCLRSYLKFLPGNIKVCNSSGSLILNTCAREFITWKDREKFARNILSGSNKILDDGSPEV